MYIPGSNGCVTKARILIISARIPDSDRAKSRVISPSDTSKFRISDAGRYVLCADISDWLRSISSWPAWPLSLPQGAYSANIWPVFCWIANLPSCAPSLSLLLYWISRRSRSPTWYVYELSSIYQPEAPHSETIRPKIQKVVKSCHCFIFKTRP